MPYAPRAISGASLRAPGRLRREEHAALGNKLEPGPGFPRARARRTRRLLPASCHEGLRQTHPKQGAFQRARGSRKPGPALRLRWGPEVAICTPAELEQRLGLGRGPVGAHTGADRAGRAGRPSPKDAACRLEGALGSLEPRLSWQRLLESWPVCPRGSDSNRARALRRKITPVAAK